MYKILFFCLFSICYHSLHSQPGPDVIFPVDINLNDLPNYPGGKVFQNTYNFALRPIGVVTIDTASDLSHISLLKEITSLSLSLELDIIPTEIKGFSKTKELRLWLRGNKDVDISFLNEFPNLETLHLQSVENITFSDYLKLDSLKTLAAWWCEKITSLKAFEKITSLESVSLRRVPLLKEFPKFSAKNQIKEVEIIKEMGNSLQNYPPNSNELVIKNLNQLSQLTDLHLMNFNCLHEFPNDLSLSLRNLRLTGMYTRYKEDGFGFKLNAIESLSRYTNLENIEFRCIGLPKFTGNFERLNLNKLLLSEVYGLEDISGIFTFNSIDDLKLENCCPKTISGSVCRTKIKKMYVDRTEAENIDFLLRCENINDLQLGCGQNLRLLNENTWLIPNLSIYLMNQGQIFHVRKKNGKIVESLNLDTFSR